LSLNFVVTEPGLIPIRVPPRHWAGGTGTCATDRPPQERTAQTKRTFIKQICFTPRRCSDVESATPFSRKLTNERLETKHAIERLPSVELQIGYLKKLPEQYAGERHVVTVGRDPDGNYLWEERPGLAPTNEEEGNARRIIRINLVPSPHEE
jgi:hypothetical protein